MHSSSLARDEFDLIQILSTSGVLHFKRNQPRATDDFESAAFEPAGNDFPTPYACARASLCVLLPVIC